MGLDQAKSEPAQDASGQDLPSSVTFRYLESSAFRIVHADGVLGGVTPRGFILMNFFSERFSLPDMTAQEVTAEGKLGRELERDVKPGIVRELEVGAMMTPDTASSLIGWLQEKIDALKQAETARGE